MYEKGTLLIMKFHINMKSLFKIVYFKIFSSKLLNVSDQFESLCESEKHNRKHIISNYVILNILKLFTCLIAPLNVCLFNKIEENNFVVCFYTTNRHSCVCWCAQKRIISSSLACGQQQLIIYVQQIYDIKLIIFYSFFT